MKAIYSLILVFLIFGQISSKNLNGNPSNLYLYTIETIEHYYYFINYNVTSDEIIVNLAETPQPSTMLYGCITQNLGQFSFLYVDNDKNTVGIVNYSYDTNKMEISSEINFNKTKERDHIAPVTSFYLNPISYDDMNNLVYVIGESTLNNNVTLIIYNFNTNTFKNVVFDQIFLFETVPSGLLNSEGNYYYIHYFDVYGNHNIIEYNIDEDSSMVFTLEKHSFVNQDIQILMVYYNSLYVIDQANTQPYIVDYGSGTVKPVTYKTAGGTLFAANTILSNNYSYFVTFGINYNTNSTYASYNINNRQTLSFQTPELVATQLILFSAQ